MDHLAPKVARPADDATGNAAEALEAAERLADALANGAALNPITIEDAPLAAGECAYADLDALGWRFYGLDAVAYERRTVLAGGPYLMAMAGLASVLGNRRRCHDAERAAAPQWRPLGALRVIVTSERLLVWHQGGWWSVWYGSVIGLRPDAADGVLDLLFDSDPPYRLAGPGVASLGVAFSYALALRGAPA